MTVPVIQAAIDQNPGIHITIITRGAFTPLFDGMDVDFIIPDLNGKHKGILGLYRLFRETKKAKKWYAFLDLHDVLRSKILRLFFQMSGVASFHIDKGRKEKKALTSKSGKVIKPLTHTTKRYATIFLQAGLKLDLETHDIGTNRFPTSEPVLKLIGETKSKRIGIAPFAKHVQKIYPFEKMQKVIDQLDLSGYEIFIFGAGEKEKKKADKFCQNKSKTKSLIGQFSFSEELAALSKMDVILCMDSASMHLASLTGTKVISIWGATHPYAGFIGFGQDNKDQIIQVPNEDLSCRPCSVFGNKPCHRGDFACMNMIDPNSIVERIVAHV